VDVLGLYSLIGLPQGRGAGYNQRYSAENAMRRALLPLLLLLLLPLAALAGEKGPKVGEAAPDFTLKDASGKAIALSSFKGKVVLLDFWATYCKPCKAELPILDRFWQKNQKQGLVVLGVDVDPEPEVAREFLAKSPVSFPLLFDPDDASRELFGGPEMPALFLLDRDGKLLAIHRGALAENDPFFLEVEKLLSAKKSK
jgi:peroxiredoxin